MNRLLQIRETINPLIVLSILNDFRGIPIRQIVKLNVSEIIKPIFLNFFSFFFNLPVFSIFKNNILIITSKISTEKSVTFACDYSMSQQQFITCWSVPLQGLDICHCSLQEEVSWQRQLRSAWRVCFLILSSTLPLFDSFSVINSKKTPSHRCHLFV